MALAPVLLLAALLIVFWTEPLGAFRALEWLTPQVKAGVMPSYALQANV